MFAICRYICASSLHCCLSNPVRLLLEVIGSTKYAVGNVSISLDVASVVLLISVTLPRWVSVAFAHALYGLICGQ